MALEGRISELIGEMASVVRNLYEIEEPIVDISRTVSMMGGKITEDSSMYEPARGKVRKTGDHSFEIIISSSQNEGQRNLAVAHGLGHLFLHMGYRSNAGRWDSQNGMAYPQEKDAWLEQCAGEFAEAFLMPERDFRLVMDRYMEGSMVDTSAVARYFHVPISVAANRGRRLGYLRW